MGIIQGQQAAPLLLVRGLLGGAQLFPCRATGLGHVSEPEAWGFLFNIWALLAAETIVAGWRLLLFRRPLLRGLLRLRLGLALCFLGCAHTSKR